MCVRRLRLAYGSLRNRKPQAPAASQAFHDRFLEAGTVTERRQLRGRKTAALGAPTLSRQSKAKLPSTI